MDESSSEGGTPTGLRSINLELMQKRIGNLEEENRSLRTEFQKLASDTDDVEEQEARLVKDIAMQLGKCFYRKKVFTKKGFYEVQFFFAIMRAFLNYCFAKHLTRSIYKFLCNETLEKVSIKPHKLLNYVPRFCREAHFSSAEPLNTQYLELFRDF